MNKPVPFDYAVRLVTQEGDMGEMDIIVHRGPDWKVLCWHSPLTDGAIKCSICENGARVHLSWDIWEVH